MSLGQRDPRAMHRTAGVDPELWWDFRPGQKVFTREGYAGTVVAVQDGPHAGNEEYIVELDGGLGGGEYSSSELRDGTAVMARKATKEAVELHLASDDYEELTDVLHERLPLEHALPVTASAGSPETMGEENIKVIRQMTDVDTLRQYLDQHEMLRGGPWDTGQFERFDEVIHERLRELGASLHVATDWIVVDDEGEQEAGPFRNSYDAKEVAVPADLNVETVHNEEHMFEAAYMAGLFDTLVDHIPGGAVDWYADKTKYTPGNTPSVDWCRYRRNSHCWYPRHLDAEASKKAGYAVWIPEDRGHCPRDEWDEQKACSVGEPGPKSGDPRALLDATIGWEEGGQRTQQTEHISAVQIRTRADTSFQWHFDAAWKDIQAKARKIKDEGHIRVISATAGYVTAEVRGESNIYQTTIMRVPGKKAIAMWECGCPWSNYSWARSGRWKKYEGRMCAHALALTYEAQAREMFGQDIKQDFQTPKWRNDPTIPVVRPGDSRTKPTPWRVGSRYKVVAVIPEGTPGTYGSDKREAVAWSDSEDGAQENADDFEALGYKDVQITREGFNYAVEPWTADPLLDKLVDYKPERPLDDPEETMALKSIAPHAMWTTYTRMPFFQSLMQMQGVNPTHDSVEKLVSSRETLFGRQPTVPYRLDEDVLVFTQPTVNTDKVQQMIRNGVTAGGPPAFLIKYQGKDFVIDGHHRIAAQMLKKIYNINAKILDLDKHPVTSSLRMTAMPPIASNPTFDEVVAWYVSGRETEEHRVSRDMQDVARREGGELGGFEHRFKGIPRLKEKLKERQSRGGDPRLWISDALRYTLLFHPAVYSKSAQDALYGLQEKGYVIQPGEENSWQRGDSFSTLAYTLLTPGGFIIELQFATAESFRLKQETLHKMYEEFRQSSTSRQRKQELWDEMTRYWNKVEIPEGALEWAGERRYTPPLWENPRTRVACHAVDTDPSLRLAPAVAMKVEADLMAKVRGVVEKILAIVGKDLVRLDSGRLVPVQEVEHPKWSPTLGITDFHPMPRHGVLNDSIGWDSDPHEYMPCNRCDGTGIDPLGHTCDFCAGVGTMLEDDLRAVAATERESALEPCDHFEPDEEFGESTCKNCLWAVGAHSAKAGGPTGHGRDPEGYKTGGKRDTPASHYGLTYDASLVNHPEVQAAKAFKGWDSLPLSDVSPHGLYATEEMLMSSSIDKVLSGKEPLREGYDAYVARLSDGREVVIDGHHRAAMATGAGRSLRAHVLDMATHHSAQTFDTSSPLGYGDGWTRFEVNHDDDPEGFHDPLAEPEYRATDAVLAGDEGGVLHVLAPSGMPYPYDRVEYDPSRWTASGHSFLDEASESGLWDNSRGPETDHEADTEGGKHRGPKSECPLCVTSAAFPLSLLPWSKKAARDDYGHEVVVQGGETWYSHPDGSISEDDGGSPSPGYTWVPDPSTGDEAWRICPEHGATCEDGAYGSACEHDGCHWRNRYTGYGLAPFETALHDEPEPALPSTDGAEDDDPFVVESMRILERPAWVLGSGGPHQREGNAEIAAFAEKFLKEGMKAFTADEQKAIIDEGTQERAANLDRLDIVGTHYEALDRLVPDDDDSWMY